MYNLNNWRSDREADGAALLKLCPVRGAQVRILSPPQVMIRRSADIVEKARALRHKKLSFQEISRILKIPSTTIRTWCYDFGIDRHESLRINNEYRRNLIRALDIKITQDLNNISSESAHLFAAILYGCEGCKYPATTNISFVNSNPKIIKTFIKLLRKAFVLDENKFRVHLQIYNDHDFKKLKNFGANCLASR